MKYVHLIFSILLTSFSILVSTQQQATAKVWQCKKKTRQCVEQKTGNTNLPDFYPTLHACQLDCMRPLNALNEVIIKHPIPDTFLQRIQKGGDLVDEYDSFWKMLDDREQSMYNLSTNRSIRNAILELMLRENQNISVNVSENLSGTITGHWDQELAELEERLQTLNVPYLKDQLKKFIGSYFFWQHNELSINVINQRLEEVVLLLKRKNELITEIEQLQEKVRFHLGVWSKKSKRILHNLFYLNKSRLIVLPLTFGHHKLGWHVTTGIVDTYTKIIHIIDSNIGNTFPRLAEDDLYQKLLTGPLKDYQLNHSSSFWEEGKIPAALQLKISTGSCQTWFLFTSLLSVINIDVPKKELIYLYSQNPYAEKTPELLMELLFYLEYLLKNEIDRGEGLARPYQEIYDSLYEKKAQIDNKKLPEDYFLHKFDEQIRGELDELLDLIEIEEEEIVKRKNAELEKYKKNIMTIETYINKINSHPQDKIKKQSKYLLYVKSMVEILNRDYQIFLPDLDLALIKFSELSQEENLEKALMELIEYMIIQIKKGVNSKLREDYLKLFEGYKKIIQRNSLLETRINLQRKV